MTIIFPCIGIGSCLKSLAMHLAGEILGKLITLKEITTTINKIKCFVWAKLCEKIGDCTSLHALHFPFWPKSEYIVGQADVVIKHDVLNITSIL